MYLEEHISDAKLEEKNKIKPEHRIQMYYGYAFESYCASDKPEVKHGDTSGPEWGGDVDTNVQWCCVVKTKLADTRMIIGGEVDCVRETYAGQTDTFVELKTSLVIRPRNLYDEAKFEKKLLKLYFQSFLLGVPEIVVGFRTPSGVLETTQTFKTIEIPRLVRDKAEAWNPLLCLDWGQRFISFLKSVVQNQLSDLEQHKAVWRVQFEPRVGVKVFMLDQAGVTEVESSEDRVGFLPAWYWQELQNNEPASASVSTRPDNSIPPVWQI